jgi:hypothetical protein
MPRAPLCRCVNVAAAPARRGHKPLGVREFQLRGALALPSLAPILSEGISTTYARLVIQACWRMACNQWNRGHV